MKVDFVALAQHYELNTDYLDVTSGIVTAAFFATNYYYTASNEYLVKKDGVGCIRYYCDPISVLAVTKGKLQLVGLKDQE